MKSGIIVASLFVALVFMQATRAMGDDDPLKALQGIKFGVLGYIDYSNGKIPLPNNATDKYNRFSLTRGYFTIQKTATPQIGMRLTTDITQDATVGDYKVRIKYLYAELSPSNLGPLTEMKTELGMGHIPWLDFEESIDPFRDQGTMAIERASVFASADLGANIRGDIAGRLADAKTKTGNPNYDGRYGSWHLGVYNGSGYSAPENNTNKAIEGRLSIRPLPDIVPGLQLSYFGLTGKGNTRSAINNKFPDYNVNLGMLSFEHPYVILTAQYFATTGNAKGNWVADTTTSSPGKALKTKGFSIFGNVKIPSTEKRLSAFARYDNFNEDSDKIIADKAAYSMVFGGLAYDIYNGNMLLADYEVTTYQDNAGTKGNLPKIGNKLEDESKFQVVYQIKF